MNKVDLVDAPNCWKLWKWNPRVLTSYGFDGDNTPIIRVLQQALCRRRKWIKAIDELMAAVDSIFPCLPARSISPS